MAAQLESSRSQVEKLKGDCASLRKKLDAELAANSASSDQLKHQLHELRREHEEVVQTLQKRLDDGQVSLSEQLKHAQEEAERTQTEARLSAQKTLEEQLATLRYAVTK